MRDIPIDEGQQEKTWNHGKGAEAAGVLHQRTCMRCCRVCLSANWEGVCVCVGGGECCWGTGDGGGK